jgi:hypothetical protein
MAARFRRSKQTAGCQPDKGRYAVTVTLAVHPLCGEELVVTAAYGRSAVRAETADGRIRLLPLAWTSLQPRPDPLAVEDRVVRLAPDALRSLASWIRARVDNQKLGLADREDHKRDDGVGKLAPRSAAAAAMVGEARAPEARRRGERKRGTR